MPFLHSCCHNMNWVFCEDHEYSPDQCELSVKFLLMQTLYSCQQIFLQLLDNMLSLLGIHYLQAGVGPSSANILNLQYAQSEYVLQSAPKGMR